MHRTAVWVQTVLVPTLGPFGIFLAAFVDASFLSLFEINDLLVVGAAWAQPERIWLTVLMAALGSAAGSSIVWWIGKRGGEALLVERLGRARADRARAAFRRWDVWVLAIPAVLPPPAPFKVFVLGSGALGFSFRRFFVTVFLARAVRYGLWALLGVVYGRRAGELLASFDARFWSWMPWVLSLTGAAILLVLLFYLRRRAAPRNDPTRGKLV